MINLSTKCEISISTTYENMKGEGKCRNWCGWQQLWVTEGRWK